MNPTESIEDGSSIDGFGVLFGASRVEDCGELGLEVVDPLLLVACGPVLCSAVALGLRVGSGPT